MTNGWNRREMLSALLMSTPGAAALAAALADGDLSCAAGPEGKPRPRITISKETTYITEPLRPDGYPDYVAALNQRCRQGVTPENNAAVLVWKALGPDAIEPPHREAYWKMLGIAPLPEQGDYFRGFYAHASAWSVKNGVPDEEAEKRLSEQFDVAMKRPWSAKEFPILAEWLQVNERPMKLLAEASKRPRRYDPWFWDEDGDFPDVGAVPISAYRDLARFFALRAMLRMHAGQPEAACDDIVITHRFARLLAQGPTMIESLVAVTIDGIARQKLWVLLEKTGLPETSLVAIQREFVSSPAIGNAAQMFGLGERFFLLAGVCSAARKPTAERNGFLTRMEGMIVFDGTHARLKPLLELLGNAEIDWDIALREGNAWSDRLVAAFGQPERAKRNKAIAEMQTELDQLERSRKNVESLRSLPAAERSKTAMQWICDLYVAIFVGGNILWRNIVSRVAAETELTRVAFALREFRIDRGVYPATLAELTPKYIAAVPKDIFAKDAELRYRREGDGYCVYSVGINGRDDGGRGLEEYSAAHPASEATTPGEQWDDIVVRVGTTKR